MVAPHEPSKKIQTITDTLILVVRCLYDSQRWSYSQVFPFLSYHNDGGWRREAIHNAVIMAWRIGLGVASSTTKHWNYLNVCSKHRSRLSVFVESLFISYWVLYKWCYKTISIQMMEKSILVGRLYILHNFYYSYEQRLACCV
jgi:hypothetical protein